MSNKELNQQLYTKVLDALKAFSEKLMKCLPQEILDNAREYSLKKDIHDYFAVNDLPDDVVKALLTANDPLNDIYTDLSKSDLGGKAAIKDCIYGRAENILKSYEETMRESPVYRKSVSIALANMEIEKYQVSERANVACRDAISDAIERNYSSNRLDPRGAEDILRRFGEERTMFVLSSTVMCYANDIRFSEENRSFAKAMEMPPLKDTKAYILRDTHVGLVDLFMKQARKEVTRQKEKKPSVIDKLKSLKPDTPMPKKIPKKEQAR